MGLTSESLLVVYMDLQCSLHYAFYRGFCEKPMLTKLSPDL